MNIVVSPGRTVHRVAKPAVKQADNSYSRPVVKAYGPTHLIRDVPEDEARHLIACGFALEHKPVVIVESEPKATEKVPEKK